MANKTQLIHCSYHKCLTGYYSTIFDILFNKIFFLSSGYKHYNSDLDGFYQSFEQYKVVSLNNHSLDLSRLGEFKMSRFIRDPRDMIVSGYFYHKRGAEDWCNIVNPQGDEDKIRNPEILEKMGTEHSFSSYLQSLNEEQGLLTEIEFRKQHFLEMEKFPTNDNRITLFKYEDILANEVNVMCEIYDFYGLNSLQKHIGLRLAKHYSAENQMGKKAHIRNPSANQWKKVFTPKVEARFNDLFSDLLTKYEYN